MNLTADDLKLDRLQLYFGSGYQINDHLIIRQPRVGDIVELGENNYFMGLNAIIQTAWESKAPLWDAGYDWEKLNDFEFFCMRIKALEPFITKIFFERNIDFRQFELKENLETNSIFLEQELEDGYLLRIDEYIYSKIVCFLRTLHGISPPVVRHPPNLNVKRLQIEMDKREQKARSKKSDDSFLLTSIAALVASSEFKYNSTTIKDIPLCEFYMSLDRIQINRQSQSLLNGMYANADFSKMKDFNTIINWLRPVHKNAQSNLKLGKS